MIIDARIGHGAAWSLYDIKRCRRVECAVWVNDETAQWGHYTGTTFTGEWLIETIQEDRISIYPSRRLVLFNEVDDANDTTTEQLVVERTA